MTDAAAVVSNFIFKWSQEKYILLRFRILMATLMVVHLFLVDCTYLAPIRYGRTVSSFSDAILMYVLGAVQAAPVKYGLFPVWALALVSFRSSFKGLTETYNTQVELGNVVKLLVVAYMNVTQGTEIGRVPFWIFWSLLVLKCFYRIVTLCRASKTLWHSRSSELLQAYMGPDQPHSNFVDNNTSSSTPNGAMEGCKYLVYGESEPEYSCRINATRDLNIDGLRNLLTLDTIYKREDVWTRSKKVCLAFALSRLLRCKLEGAKLHAGTVSMNRKLLIRNCDEPELLDLFNILMWDVGFLRDFLFTNYPMIFSKGFCSLGACLIMAALKFSMALWLSGDFFSEARHLSLDRSGSTHQHKLSATDLKITGVAIYFTALSDGYEMFKYCFLSDWMSLLAVHRWVNCGLDYLSLRCRALFHSVILSASLSTMLFLRGVEYTEQYVFLESYNSACKCSCLLHLLTVGRVGSSTKEDGKLATSIRTPQQVKTAVLSEAFQVLDHLVDDVHSLPRDCFAPMQQDANAPAPASALVELQYWSEIIQTTRAPKCSRVILILHIATSLCEIDLAREHGVSLSRSPFSAALSRLKFFLRSFCPHGIPYNGDRWIPYLVKEKLPSDDLWKNYMVANCLSRYCAYLLVSKPDLLPGNIWVSNKAFQQTVQCAREMLDGCDSLESKYDKLILASHEEATVVLPATDEGSEILRQGTRLAKKLINDEVKEKRWEILAKLWPRLLVHLSPSSNAQAHVKYLESKYFPELITIVWALFSHCGIEKSELWDAASLALMREQDAHVDNIRLWSTSRQPPAEVQETTGPSDPHIDNIRLWSTSHQPAGDLEDGGGEIQEINRGG
uniref:DUF4220 domain-containing protein n=1 Tax=Oryza glumipatula TaxID=40148 RepID=A0A0E0BL90_9ORYZ